MWRHDQGIGSKRLLLPGMEGIETRLGETGLTGCCCFLQTTRECGDTTRETEIRVVDIQLERVETRQVEQGKTDC